MASPNNHGPASKNRYDVEGTAPSKTTVTDKYGQEIYCEYDMTMRNWELVRELLKVLAWGLSCGALASAVVLFSVFISLRASQIADPYLWLTVISYIGTETFYTTVIVALTSPKVALRLQRKTYGAGIVVLILVCVALRQWRADGSALTVFAAIAPFCTCLLVYNWQASAKASMTDDDEAMGASHTGVVRAAAQSDEMKAGNGLDMVKETTNPPSTTPEAKSSPVPTRVIANIFRNIVIPCIPTFSVTFVFFGALTAITISHKLFVAAKKPLLDTLTLLGWPVLLVGLRALSMASIQTAATKIHVNDSAEQGQAKDIVRSAEDADKKVDSVIVTSGGKTQSPPPLDLVTGFVVPLHTSLFAVAVTDAELYNVYTSTTWTQFALGLSAVVGMMFAETMLGIWIVGNPANRNNASIFSRISERIARRTLQPTMTENSIYVAKPSQYALARKFVIFGRTVASVTSAFRVIFLHYLPTLPSIGGNICDKSGIMGSYTYFLFPMPDADDMLLYRGWNVTVRVLVTFGSLTLTLFALLLLECCYSVNPFRVRRFDPCQGRWFITSCSVIVTAHLTFIALVMFLHRRDFQLMGMVGYCEHGEYTGDMAHPQL
ncbi:uncharacterized protein SPPG_06045 [Spizellomyces punctatus DAOM BR117]|uniref:Transmembrane protein n=1 Tax=Spizellomyces punctatus (strain DAOM BR117) TaxID=645134 RepID=A0A0L0HDM3_SPIPD|nr:uncharacterized protein SPPG_06045 [Spizellomyces punctatus DAOM BR117]KNC99101.1 hypothetical protein SPPG_06045 [Spizellomyces punctatus DAOM BR117]|eukprot:XP_016607141.1 hypothetical protein SPPG_06045 [Spizellomyces punctatus DAOM BR117]